MAMCADSPCDQKPGRLGLCDRHYLKRHREGTLPAKTRELTCKRCGKTFVGDSRRWYCDPCKPLRRKENRLNEATLRWREKNPEKHREINRRVTLKKKYGITPEDFDAMMEAQGGICALAHCDRPADRIDHCHYTGRVRGLVCHRCNLLLAGFEDPTFREAAARYLGLEVSEVSFLKHGTGKVLKAETADGSTPEQVEWTEEDQAGLEVENDVTDAILVQESDQPLTTDRPR